MKNFLAKTKYSLLGLIFMLASIFSGANVFAALPYDFNGHNENATVLTVEIALHIANENDFYMEMFSTIPGKKLTPANFGNMLKQSADGILQQPLCRVGIMTAECFTDSLNSEDNKKKIEERLAKSENPILATQENLKFYFNNDDFVWELLKIKLIKDGVDPVLLEELFKKMNGQYSQAFMAQKVIELYSWRCNGKASLNLPDDEAANFAPPNYQALAGSMNASACRNFMQRNKKLLDGIYSRYGVPPAIVTSILLVETGIGGNLGNQSAFRVLASMAASDSLASVEPAIRGLNLTAEQRKTLELMVWEKAQWARNELVALINYGTQNNMDIVNIPGSMYGAIGLCQFMPSNIKIYGVDADGDKVVNLFKVSDAASSVGCYLSSHGWKKATSPKAQLEVIRSYNHSDIYAATVYGVAMQLISPTTHASTQAAINGGNTVSAVKKTVNAYMGGGSKQFVNGTGIELFGYSDIINIK